MTKITDDDKKDKLSNVVSIEAERARRRMALFASSLAGVNVTDSFAAAESLLRDIGLPHTYADIIAMEDLVAAEKKRLLAGRQPR